MISPDCQTATKWIWLLILISCCSQSCHALPQQVTEMIHSWAPLIWLHSGEQFSPSSVDFFLRYVSLQNRRGRFIDDCPAPDRLPGGPDSAQLHLQTHEKLPCPTCLGPAFFYGQPVANGGVPVYAIVRQYYDAWNTIDVVYHTFYPYNRGKDVCIGILTANDNCLGSFESFGNHVGDWEHATLRFQNGRPQMLYLSVHNFGAYYSWDQATNCFQLARSESPKQKAARRGRKMSRRFTRDLWPTFPETVQMSGTHPVVYSANGSHGLWGAPGRHTYSTFPLLEDFCDDGTPWNTWENLVIIPWNESPYPYTGSLSWLNFKGSWGNSKSGCDLEPISGECRLNNGPHYPEGPDDIAAPHIQRTRYIPQPQVPPVAYVARKTTAPATAVPYNPTYYYRQPQQYQQQQPLQYRQLVLPRTAVAPVVAG